MGDVREKKIKQSIVIIGIILGLCGYYSVKRPACYMKNTEREISISPSGINKDVRQGEALFGSFE